MNLTTAYCQTRRHLEERTWVLTSRHAALTARLILLVGLDHETFRAALDQCRTTCQDISDSRSHLADHRRGHGC